MPSEDNRSGPAPATDEAALEAFLRERFPEVDTSVDRVEAVELRRPAFAGVVAEARLLRLGRRAALAEVRLSSVGEAEPVAVATVGYSLPSPAPRAS